MKMTLGITLSLIVNFHNAIYASQDFSGADGEVKSSPKLPKFLTADEFNKTGLQIVKRAETPDIHWNDLPFELTQHILSLVPFKHTHKVCKAFHLIITGYENVGIQGFNHLPDFKVPVNVHKIRLNFQGKSQQQIDTVPSKAIYTLSQSMTILYPAMLKKLQYTHIKDVRISDAFVRHSSTKVS